MTHSRNVTLRDVRAGDLTAIRRLNNRAGASILPMDAAQIDWFHGHADYFRVAEAKGRVAGFLIAMQPDATYASSNFRWFRSHYDAFVYIDRVVIGDRYRGHGLGRLLYSDVQSYAEVRSPNLGCEVSLEPRDDVSLLFHGTFGFHEVGQHVMPESNRRVSLLLKGLCSYPFIRETYPDGLPKLPWLTPRELAAGESASGQSAAGAVMIGPGNK